MPYGDCTGPYGDGPRMGRGKRRGRRGFWDRITEGVEEFFGRRGYGWRRGPWWIEESSTDMEKQWIENRLKWLENEKKYWEERLKEIENYERKEETDRI